jgi:hypothetical protein
MIWRWYDALKLYDFIICICKCIIRLVYIYNLTLKKVSHSVIQITFTENVDSTVL